MEDISSSSALHIWVYLKFETGLGFCVVLCYTEAPPGPLLPGVRVDLLRKSQSQDPDVVKIRLTLLPEDTPTSVSSRNGPEGETVPGTEKA